MKGNLAVSGNGQMGKIRLHYHFSALRALFSQEMIERESGADRTENDNIIIWTIRWAFALLVFRAARALKDFSQEMIGKNEWVDLAKNDMFRKREMRSHFQ